MRMSSDEYAAFVDSLSPRSPIWGDLLRAWLVGGVICTLGQALTDLYTACGAAVETASAWCSITLVFLGALLTGLGVYDDLARFELGQIGGLAVETAEIAPRELLGQNVEKHGVLIVGDGLVDAAVFVSLRGEDMPLPAGDERAHAVSGAQRKDLLLQNIIVLKPVFLARGVEDPVADIDEIQQPPELLVGELNVHPAPAPEHPPERPRS